MVHVGIRSNKRNREKSATTKRKRVTAKSFNRGCTPAVSPWATLQLMAIWTLATLTITPTDRDESMWHVDAFECANSQLTTAMKNAGSYKIGILDTIGGYGWEPFACTRTIEDDLVVERYWFRKAA